MSELHQAVQDELAAHRPDRVPPFAAVRARKRTRDRRRLATGGVALSAFAIAGAAAVALAPSLGDGTDRLPQYAGPPAPAASAPAAGTWTGKFTVRYTARGPVDPGTAERVEACLALPGVHHADKTSVPPVHGVTVTEQGESEAFAACVRALAGDGVTLTEHRLPALDTDADIAAFVESCAWGRTPTPVPGYVGMTQDQALAPGRNFRILGRDGICNLGSPVPDPTIVDVVISDGVVVWAGHLPFPGQPNPAATTPAPEPVATDQAGKPYVQVGPYSVSSDGLTVNVRLVVADGCQTPRRTTITADESRDSVTLEVHGADRSSSTRPDTERTCPSEYRLQSVPVGLAEPLGDRPVLDSSGRVLEQEAQR